MVWSPCGISHHSWGLEKSRQSDAWAPLSSTLEALLQTRRDLWVLHVGAQRAIAQPDLGVAYNETCLLMESGGSERVEERPTHGEALPWFLELLFMVGGGLGLSPGMATCQRCDVGHFIEPLCASVSTPVKCVQWQRAFPLALGFYLLYTHAPHSCCPWGNAPEHPGPVLGKADLGL